MHLLVPISICLISLAACSSGGGGGAPLASGSPTASSSPTVSSPTPTASNSGTLIAASADQPEDSDDGPKTPTETMMAEPETNPTVEFEPDTLLLSDMIVELPGQPDARLRSSCVGGSCTLRYGDVVSDISLDALLAQPQDLSGFQVTSQSTRGGVTLYEFRVSVPVEGYGTALALGYGAWLGESAFVSMEGNFDTGLLAGVSIGYGMSIGEATGTNPQALGGATWMGAMSGVDYGRSNQAVTGTAMLDVDDFSNPDLDIAFTGISGGRADMNWSNLSVTNGTFDGGSIEGRFYGPGAENVGGIFDLNSIIGAFGAQR